MTAFHLKSRYNLCDVERENINTAFSAVSPLLRCPAAALLAKNQPSERPLLAEVSRSQQNYGFSPSLPAILRRSNWDLTPN